MQDLPSNIVTGSDTDATRCWNSVEIFASSYNMTNILHITRTTCWKMLSPIKSPGQITRADQGIIFHKNQVSGKKKTICEPHGPSNHSSFSDHLT